MVVVLFRKGLALHALCTIVASDASQNLDPQYQVVSGCALEEK